jgi:transcriptional regulator with XRE-family HTH domain
MTPPRSAAPAGRRSNAGSAGAKKSAKSRATGKADASRNGDAPVARSAGADRDVDAAEQTMLHVGARIRAMRLRQQLTLRDVAERTGVSVSMLSMLERGVSTASVGTLVAVASALGVHMYDLFAHKDGADGSPVTRLTEQTVVRLGQGTTRRVAHNDADAGLELAVNEYEVGGASGPSATHHDGREFGVLIQGQLTIELDGQSHVLEPGDVIAYSSDRPHRIANTGDEPALAVWVNVDES